MAWRPRRCLAATRGTCFERRRWHSRSHRETLIFLLLSRDISRVHNNLIVVSATTDSPGLVFVPRRPSACPYGVDSRLIETALRSETTYDRSAETFSGSRSRNTAA